MARYFKIDRSFPPSGTSRLFDVDARRATVGEIEDTLDELAQAYRDIASIKRKMDGIRMTLAHRKTQLNTYTHVSAMPPEILREIFLQCLCNHRFQLDDLPLRCDICTMKRGGRLPALAGARFLSTLSGVCSTWKSIVMSSPELWVTIDVGAGKVHVAEALMQSARMPLTIRADLCDVEDSPSGTIRFKKACSCVRSALKQLHRIEELHIYNWWCKLEKPFIHYVNAQAPILRRLAITYDTCVSEYMPDAPGALFPLILSSTCPVLEILYLGGCGIRNIRPALLPALRELHFSQTRFPPTPLADVLSVLANLPLLSNLTLDQQCSFDRWDYLADLDAVKTVVLPNLRAISLAGFPSCLLFTGRLELPAISTIRSSDGFCTDITGQYTDDFSLIIPWLASYRALRLPEDSPGNKPAYRFRFGPGVGSRYMLNLERCTGSPSHYPEVQCDFRANTNDASSPLMQVCEALKSVPVQEIDIRTFDQSRDVPLCTEDWSKVMQALPHVEVLHISGRSEGVALFKALSALETVSHHPLPMLNELGLIPTTHIFDCDSDDEEYETKDEWIKAYLAELAGILLKRKQHGFMLENLKLNARNYFSEQDFAPLVPLVARVTLYNTLSRPIVAPTEPCLGGGSIRGKVATKLDKLSANALATAEYGDNLNDEVEVEVEEEQEGVEAEVAEEDAWMNFDDDEEEDGDGDEDGDEDDDEDEDDSKDEDKYTDEDDFTDGEISSSGEVIPASPSGSGAFDGWD